MRASYHLYLVNLLAILSIMQQRNQAVEYKIINHAQHSPGGVVFETKLKSTAEGAIDNARKHILHIFGQSGSSGDGAQVEKITLVIEQMPNDSTSELKNRIGRICINAGFIADSSTSDVGSHFMDLMYYELTHILLWKPEDNIPVELKDGIAAYIVLEFGTGKPRGVVKYGEGNSWNENRYVTARFFQFCSAVLCDKSFVPRLYGKMKDSSSYDEKYFVELTHKTISEAWKEYKDKYKS